MTRGPGRGGPRGRLAAGVARIVIAIAFAAGLAACAATAAERREPSSPMTGGAAGPVLLAPSLAGVDPRFLPELERVQALIADGNYSAARRVLDALLQREPVGPALSAARAFERMLDLDPSFLPSLQALARAVESGSDREATAILKRMYLRQPRGRVLELLEAYRRILDGRAVVANLRLRLECRPEKEIPKGAPEGAKVARLFLVAECGLHETVELDTGPATLFVTRSVVGSGGIERDAVETKTYDGFSRLMIEPGKSAEVSLAAFFVSTAEGEIASRMRFELDVRSGSARILPGGAASAAAAAKPEKPAKNAKPEPATGAREVPVMRMRVAEAEETALERELRGLPAAAPEDLAAFALEPRTIDVTSALGIAVRIPPAERERALDLLAPAFEDLAPDAASALVPSLRWIAVTSEPGGNPAAWRAWLRARETKKAGERPNLLLPTTAPERTEP